MSNGFVGRNPQTNQVGSRLSTGATHSSLVDTKHGSAWVPVNLPVFKTGGRRVTPSSVGSTPTRFRQVSMT
jgi:hypothetical protein